MMRKVDAKDSEGGGEIELLHIVRLLLFAKLFALLVSLFTHCSLVLLHAQNTSNYTTLNGPYDMVYQNYFEWAQ
jgi:hypothetical protein